MRAHPSFSTISTGRSAAGLAAIGGLICLGSFGCSDPAVVEPGRPDTYAKSNVTGSIIYSYVTEKGDIEGAPSPGAITVSALDPQDNGTLSPRIPGTLSADGSFIIPDVRDGVYYLMLEQSNGFRSIVVTSDRDVDLGAHFAGRPDAASAKTSPTNIAIKADGLSPWKAADDLHVFALGSVTSGTYQAADVSATPAPGNTSLNGLTFDASTFGFSGLVNGNKGDVAYVTQLVADQEGGSSYVSLTKVLKPAPFVQEDGKGTTLTGSFEDVEQRLAKIAWSRGEVMDADKEVHPAAKWSSDALSIFAEPGGAKRATDLRPTLAYLTNQADASVTLSLPYANPFPEGWGVFVSAQTSFEVPFTAPGDAMAHMELASVIVEAALDPAGENALAPVLHPPTDLKINDIDATTDLTGVKVGGSPRVSWSGPKVGSPTLYRVAVRLVDPTRTFPRTVLEIITKDTSATIPEDVLEPGSFYLVRIMARTDASIEAPYRYSHGARAEAVSGLFTP